MFSRYPRFIGLDLRSVTTAAQRRICRWPWLVDVRWRFSVDGLWTEPKRYGAAKGVSYSS